METPTRPDQQIAGLDTYNHREPEPQHHILSGEKWQNIFHNLYQRAGVSPERDQQTERQYELRHEHKDVTANDGLHIGAVIAASLEDTSSSQTNIPTPGGSKRVQPQPSQRIGQAPGDTKKSHSLVARLVVAILLLLIFGLLYMLI